MDFDPKKNYYDILWVDEKASEDDIKKAFRKAAVKHHPDRGGDAEKFKEVNEAHQILSDAQKRQQYDMFRSGGFGGFGWQGFWGFGWGWFGWFSGGVDLWDLVGDLFGGWFGGSSSSWVRRGDDIQIALSISFEESFHGVEKEITYARMVKADGITEETCHTCGGRGKVAQKAQTPFGVMQVQSACPTCQWMGKIYKKDGKILWWWGLERQEETITVKVPSGINDGVYIKFSGRGNEGTGGAPVGDLYVKIRIGMSNKYERQGDDLYVKAKVSIYDMVLGGEITIDHPEGKMTVKIPKGTQVGDKIRIKKKGFGDKWIFGKVGDLFILPQLHIPKRLSKDQEKLWKELKETK